MTLVISTCCRCGYEWVPQKSRLYPERTVPLTCPGCHNIHWNDPNWKSPHDKKVLRELDRIIEETRIDAEKASAIDKLKVEWEARNVK